MDDRLHPIYKTLDVIIYPCPCLSLCLLVNVIPLNFKSTARAEHFLTSLLHTYTDVCIYTHVIFEVT